MNEEKQQQDHKQILYDGDEFSNLIEEEQLQKIDGNNEFLDFRFAVKLKPDHQKRPILITPEKTIFLESFNKLYNIAYPFLIAIAEPVNRPILMHQYKITKYSLFTAMILQYNPQDIIKVLNILSKNQQIPIEVTEYILSNTKRYGSAKLFLKNGNYFIDILKSVKDVIQIEKIEEHLEEIFLNQPVQFLNSNKELQNIQKNIDDILINGNLDVQKKQQKMVIQQEEFLDESKINQNDNQLNLEQIDFDKNDDDEDNDDDDEINNENENERINSNKRNQKQLICRYKIIGNNFEVKEFIIKQNIPLIQEYDFLNEEKPKLKISLKPNVRTREYQDNALKNIFIQDKARSGILILPCGSGKTILGIIVLERIKQASVIICEGDVSVDQWRDELEKWTTISRKHIIRLTGRVQDKWDYKNEDPVIIITTYSMLSKKRERNQNEIIQQMLDLSHGWGVCIIDEVHKLPAPTFQRVLQQFKFNFKLGLTATPYREDQKIDNLFFMIGPKLYEENWLDLVKQNFLANPYCVEIRCEMEPMFLREYNEKKKNKTAKELLYTSNPTKFKALQFLIKQHEDRGDKILVFCDRPIVIEYYSKILAYPCIHGGIKQEERKKIFNWFKTSNQINTLFVSRVGDTAIDLPSANVGIQIGIHGSSRRQEVQRLGRIMRPKKNYDGEFNAFWYTLASKKTEESKHCWLRQKCLIDQGFQFEIVEEKDLEYNLIENQNKFKWMKKLDEQEYLFQILMAINTNNNNNNEEENQEKQSSSSSSESEESASEQSVKFTMNDKTLIQPGVLYVEKKN